MRLGAVVRTSEGFDLEHIYMRFSAMSQRLVRDPPTQRTDQKVFMDQISKSLAYI